MRGCRGIYGADLKRLYDKGHSAHDPETTQEDLLRRFLDWLLDKRARFQVEYVKEPKDIDDTVCELVNFMEIWKRAVTSTQKKRNRHPTRAVNPHHSESDDCSSLSDDSNCDVRTVNTRETKLRPGFKHPRSGGLTEGRRQWRKPSSSGNPRMGAVQSLYQVTTLTAKICPTVATGVGKHAEFFR